MGKYSNISKIYVKNFRNISEATLDFKESPIIALVGENEAGKTSLIKAIEVCALHAFPMDQMSFIKDNEDMFGIAIELEDGTIIKRVKQAKGINGYQIIKNNKVVYNTETISEGLPTAVKELMGLVEEPETKEYLNVRTYEDKLMFVVTPNSVNYKVMYNALKVEQLTKALKVGAVEVNALRKDIGINEGKIDVLRQQVENIRLVDLTDAIACKENLVKKKNTLLNIEKAINIKNRIDNCMREQGALALIDHYKLESIDTRSLDKINMCNKLYTNKVIAEKKLSQLLDIDNIGEINEKIVYLGDKISNRVAEHKEKKSILSRMSSIDNMSEISERVISLVDRAITSKKKINEMGNLGNNEIDKLQEINTSTLTRIKQAENIRASQISNKSSVEELGNKIKEITDILSENGVGVTTCPNCGETVIIER